ncbi:MAG: bifunctional (p)ppGpp synthetase/guanosine-3',5'-bis(diphosphate) 3'-pyrophosphohydrolase [Actinobacteria bacterium]|nr:bifunctional (p)ppGpp synthetase/guanosine-3',5'-bis(diphosphate) 3'-pyrophosphohydrolase [Actinomycetota bacterium]
MNTLIAPLLATLVEHHPLAKVADVERAFTVAETAHAGQMRKSGDEYITHPVAVAEILAELGLNSETIIAALLHDTVEDTQYSLTQMKQDFGAEVSNLVDGVTKLDKLTYGPTAEAETVRKMVVAMSRDIRVLVIKLADRLHNARTWKFVDPDSAERKARETLDIYAPLAHRLGMNAIKWELEDLSFEVLEPKKFQEIARLVAERDPSREALSVAAISQIREDLLKDKIEATVTGRQKHFFSVYQKMVVRGRDFNDIYDLVGIRVLVEDVRDCYAVLGAIHSRWSPVPGRFKDYIAMPKFNLYQSLHTTVIGPTGKAIEIQIRTYDMHTRAEYGIAAHWKYKEGADSKNSPEMLWLRQLHEWQQETSDPSEFLEALRFDLGTPEVFVFTPKGNVIALPGGSTPVDFAYAVHTQVGDRCVGAKVNGRLIPLESALVNGDVVEILTNKNDSANPSRDWLNFVKSPRARSKIKAWFSKERREEAVDAGKESIARQMRKAGLPLQKIFAGQSLLELAHELRYTDISALYSAVGDGHISAASVIDKLIATMGVEDSHPEVTMDVERIGAGIPTTRRSSSAIEVSGIDDVLVKLARCCTPVPGDAITGFITKGSGVSVHREDCVNAEDLQLHQADRIVGVSWLAGAASVFLVNIQVEALDRSRLLSDVTRTLSDQHVNILSAAVSTTKDRIAISRFTFEMADAIHLDAVLNAVRSIEGVYDVYRTNNN